jgi:hypothetical protein
MLCLNHGPAQRGGAVTEAQSRLGRDQISW